MEPIDLSPKSELFVATDVIQTAKELQTNLASMHPEMQDEFAAHAIEALGDPREIHGGYKILLHALGAHILTRGSKGLSDDETLLHGTYFGDVYMRTNFSRFAFVRHAAFRSLCLQLVETEVLSSATNPDFKGERIHSGVYVPVHSVETVLAA